MGFLNFFKQNKSGKVKLIDSEWEHLYKTNFEQFWEKVIEEGDLSTLPNCIGSLRTDELMYGEEARNCYLARLKGAISPSKFYIDNQWTSLLKIKHELKEENKPSDMLGAIRTYEGRYIKY